MWKSAAKPFIILLLLLSPYLVTAAEFSTTQALTSTEFPRNRPLVYVDPGEIIKSPDEIFTVSIKIFNLTNAYVPDPEDPKRTFSLGNLYGLEIQFSWAPTILEYVSHVVTIPIEDFPGGILHKPVMKIKNETDPAAGTCTIIFSSMRPAEPFNNPERSNTVFNVTFRVMREGASDLKFISTKLSDKDGKYISHYRYDGRFIALGAPIADFTFWPLDGYAAKDKPVMFNASASYDPSPGGKIILYMWDFGDTVQENVTGQIINHTYTTTGIYGVKLKVMDNDGIVSAPVEKSVRVVERRDVAVKDIKLPEFALLGTTLTINLIVINRGGAPEGFKVSTYYNSTPTDGWELIAEESVVDLKAGDEKIMAIQWDTSTLPLESAAYYIWANLTLVPHEESAVDNEMKSPTPIFVTTARIRDVAVTELESSVGVFAPPFILGENVTITFKVEAKGTVDETYNVTLRIIAPNGKILLTKDWSNETLSAGAKKEFGAWYIFTEAWAVGNCKITVEAIIEEDSRPDNNLMERMVWVIMPPIPKIDPLPPKIYEGDTITFNATASVHPGPEGKIKEYRWGFTEPGATVPVEYKYGSAISYTFGIVGKWTVELVLTDNWGITYEKTREPGTLPYKMEFTLIVEEKPKEGLIFPYEILYVAIGIVAIIIVGATIYLRLRKSKPA